jgi:hypothetical protein
MLFAAESDADVVNGTVEPTLKNPRSLLVDRKPIDFEYNRSDLLFDQHATHYNTFCACQNDSAMGFYPRIADNFSVTSNANVDSLVWWGGYWGTMTNSITDFLIEIYPDSGGGLGPMQDPIYSARVGFNETDLGGWYIYEAVIPPFAATAGVTYWIVFQPFLTFPPQWGNNCDVPPAWGDGQEMYFKSPYFSFPDWTTATTVFGFAYESSFQIYGTTGAAVLTWDFEDGWQDWTHTNGEVFPAAWGVMASDYKASWQLPSSGDSSMWMDSDANGGGYADTALSPVLVPNATMDWLKYGVSYNFIASGEWLEVGIKYFDGTTWTVVPLVTYTTDTGPMWDSVDVSAYSGYPRVQIYFYYDDDGIWAWYTAFDNVSIDAVIYEAAQDVASIDVIGVVENLGNTDETYDVHCVVTDPSVVLDVTINVTTLVGETDTINFGSVDFYDGNTYDIMMATLLAGDTDPTNDTLTQSTFCTVIFWEILTDMPYTASGAYAGYSMDASSNTYVHVFGGNPSAQALHYIYDVTNASWSAGTPLPTGATYGGYCSIDNKIYMIGAWTTGPGALMTIYDADSDIYTTVSLPSGETNDPGIAVKDNNYIYIIGGGGGWSGSTIVNLYDVAGDSFFTTVTQLPSGDEKMAAGTAMIAGDTIVVAAGYGASSAEAKVLFGAIDPANPANITWTHGPDYPGGATYRLSADSWEGVGYFTCGSGPLASTYAYDSGWITLPDKPTPLMNVGFVMAAVDTSLVDDVEGYGFACGGYSPYMSTFEVLHTGSITGIYEQPDDVPVAFTSRMISSNPVAGRAKIEFAMLHQGPVTFSIYDISGRRVHNSEYSSISAGTHTILWSCQDNAGRDVPAGIYFYCLEAAGNVATGKLVIVQ